MVIMQVTFCLLAPQVKKWRIPFVHSFIVCTSLLMATSTFGLWKKCYISLYGVNHTVSVTYIVFV